MYIQQNLFYGKYCLIDFYCIQKLIFFSLVKQNDEKLSITIYLYWMEGAKYVYWVGEGLLGWVGAYWMREEFV